jgi:hypothetical protein
VKGVSGDVNIHSGMPVTIRSKVEGGSGSLLTSNATADATGKANTVFRSYVDGDHDTTTRVDGQRVSIRAGDRGVGKSSIVDVKAEITNVSVGLVTGTGAASATSENNATMDAYVQDNAVVSGGTLLSFQDASPAVEIVAGSDGIVESLARGGAGSLVMSVNEMTLDATDNTAYSAYVRGFADDLTIVTTESEGDFFGTTARSSDDIVISAQGDVDVTARADEGSISFSLLGSGNIMSSTAASNAHRGAWVDGNARVNARVDPNFSGVAFRQGKVGILAGGDVDILSRLSGGGGSLLASVTDFDVVATDNSVFNASISGGSGDVATEVFADDGIEVAAHGGRDILDDGVSVTAEASALTLSGLVATNLPGVTATANTQMQAWVRGNAEARSGDGTLRIEAGDSVDVDASVLDAGAGSLLVSVNLPSATATGNVFFGAFADGINADYATVLNGERVEVKSHTGTTGVTVDSSTNGGSGALLESANIGTATATSTVTLVSRVAEHVDLDAGSLLVDANGANVVNTNITSSGGALVSQNIGSGGATGTLDIDALVDTGGVNAGVDVTGAADIKARGDQDVTMKVDNAGGGVVSVNSGLSTVTSTVNVDARVANDVELTVGSLRVDATAFNDANPGASDLNRTVDDTGGGIVSVNGPGATVTATSFVNAVIDDDAHVTTAGAIDVLSTATQTAKANVNGAGGGIISVNDGVATVTSDVTALARIGKRVDIDETDGGSASVLVKTVTQNTANAKVSNAGGGIVSVNASGAKVTATTNADALVDDATGAPAGENIAVAGAVEIRTDVTQNADVNANASGGGIVSVNDSGETVRDDGLKSADSPVSTVSTVTANAFLGDDTVVKAGSLTIESLAKNYANKDDSATDPTTRAEGGGIISVNESGALVQATTNSSAVAGTGANLSVDNLLHVYSDVDQEAAVAALNAGGGIIEVSVGGVTAVSNVTSRTRIGADAQIRPGSILVDADATNKFNAEAKTTSGGLISVGDAGIDASGMMTVEASIDDRVYVEETGATVEVSARGEQTGTTTGDAQGGGFIQVSSADTQTDSTVDVDASVGESTDLDIGSLDINALGISRSSAESYVFNGGFVAVGSFGVRALSDTQVDATIGDFSDIDAGADITLSAFGRHRVNAYSKSQNGGFVAAIGDHGPTEGGPGADIRARGDATINAATGKGVLLDAGAVSMRAGLNVDEFGNPYPGDRLFGIGVFANSNVRADGFIGSASTEIEALSKPSLFAGFGEDNVVFADSVSIKANQNAFADARTIGQTGGLAAFGGLKATAAIGESTITYPTTPVTFVASFYQTDGTGNAFGLPENVYAVDLDPLDTEFYVDLADVDSAHPLYRQSLLDNGGLVQYTDDEGRLLPRTGDIDDNPGDGLPFAYEVVGYVTVPVDVGAGAEQAAVLVDAGGNVIGVDAASGAFEAELDGSGNVVLVLDGGGSPIALGGTAPGFLTADDAEQQVIIFGPDEWTPQTIQNGEFVAIYGVANRTDISPSLVNVAETMTLNLPDYDNPMTTVTDNGRVKAAVGAGSQITTTGDIDIDASGLAHAVSDSYGFSSGLYAGYSANSETKVFNDVVAEIGPGAHLLAQSADLSPANVTMNASRFVEAISKSVSSGQAGSLNLIPVATTTAFVDTETAVREDASIRADTVSLNSNNRKLEATSEGKAEVSAFDTRIAVNATTNATAPVKVTVETGAEITGRDRVELAARFEDEDDSDDDDGGRVRSYAHKSGDAAFDTGTQYASTSSNLDTIVDFRDGATIYTLDVDFESRLDNTTEIRALTTTNSGLIDPNTGYSSHADARVHWDGTVVMAESVGQELLIHGDGRIETLSGEITASYDAFGNIVVGDLVKDEIGRVRVFAERPDYGYNFDDGVGITATREERTGVESPTGFIIDRGELVYSNIFPYVKIVNESDNDLVIGKIILASPDSALPEFVVTAQNLERAIITDWSAERSGAVNYFNRVTDAEGFTNDPAELFGAPNPSSILAPNLLTVTEADGDRSIRIFNLTGSDVIFTDIVDSEENVADKPGSVFVSNEAGRVLSEGGTARIETHLFDAFAFDNGIGSASDPIDVRLAQNYDQPGSLGAFAHGDIYLLARLLDRGALVIPSIPDPIEIPGRAVIRDVTSSSDIHLDLVYDSDFSLCCTSQFAIEGTVQALGSVKIDVDDEAKLDINGTVMAGVENYVVDIDAAGDVSLDLTNVDIEASYILPDGSLASRSYTDADWFGFETTQAGNTIALPDIVHRPGAIDIQGADPAGDWLTGSGALRVLEGYSHVTINNDSTFDLELHTIDIDQAEVATIQVNADTDVQTNEYDDIDVSPFGNPTGLIEVNASQATDVILAEQLRNSSGLTEIGIDAWSGGDIRQLGATQLIRARDIDLVAEGGGIGSTAAPILTDLKGGDLYARSQDAIYIHEIIGDLHLESALAFGPIFAGSPSDVVLTADQSITDANGADMNIFGGNVDLTALSGSIDTDLYATGAVSASAVAGSVDLDSVLTLFSSTVFADIAFDEVVAQTDLDVDASAISDVAGSLFDVGGRARFNATDGDIVLGDNPADVVNFGSLNFTGAHVAVSEDSGMHLVGDSYGATGDLESAGSITEASSVIFDGVADLFAVDDIVLDSPENDFRGTVNASAVNITLVDRNSIELGTTNATGFLDVTALAGDITDSGPASIGGTTTLAATGGITLDTAQNDFMGRVHSDGMTTTLVDASDLLLGTNTARGDFNATALDGSITQTSTDDGATVTGVTRLVATGAITMDNTSNDFMGPVNARNSTLPHDGSVGSSIYLYDSTGIELDEILSGANLTVAAVGDITDTIGSLIDAPYRANLFSLADITLGDDPSDTVNFGHYGVDAFGGDQYGLQFNGIDVSITEHSATNFFGFSKAQSLAMNSFGDMTDTGEVEVAGASSLKVSADNSIYLDTKTSAYLGDVAFDTISGNGLVNNIRFIDSSDLLLEPLRINGFLDVAAFALETSPDGTIRSLGGDISLNGYNSLVIGRGGVKGSARVNLAAVDGGFGRRSNQAGPSDLKLRGDVESTGGIISLLAGDRIIYQGGKISTPAGIALMALRGRIGEEDVPLQVDAGGFVTLYQARNDRFVAGDYEALTMRAHGNNPPDTSPFFEDVFFRGLEVLPPDPPPSETISTCTGPQCDTRTTIEKCVANPAACDVVVVTEDCRDNPNSCLPVTIVDCLANPESCMLVPCEGDPKTCGFTPWLEKIIGRPYTPVKGNAVARADESPYEITVCNGVNLFGQNEECNPVNEEADIFEIDTPLYSVERL